MLPILCCYNCTILYISVYFPCFQNPLKTSVLPTRSQQLCINSGSPDPSVRGRERGPILAQEFTKSYKFWFQRSRSFVVIELLPREEHPFPKLRANRRLSTLSISSSNARRRCNRGLANQPCGLPLGCSRFAFILSRENADRNNNHPRT